ncbi:phytochelatin synthase [Nostoc sp. CENA67]|uniref:glutathione gamma-glutamylcysteinyltransferase n=1 Tax=Amazonocrinis nigriterrae CENA67 TaxID=2794033 RepID=A0A8J7HZP0_9NOST|nr:phytochelatin synthase family protein [Amazonocrinis nigriterrae]MBH8565314.1 phytochelatin synthase [Amazonocrinis nigriterrae CENA67]
MTKTDLHAIKLKAFQQPIRCCNVTAIAYGLTALGYPTNIDDIFYVTRLPIDTVLDDGMTLAETYDTCVKYVEEKNLPISVIVEHFDKASMTLESFIQEIERAIYDENDIHILNFNVDIAHEIKLGGGHFSLLADYDKTTQEITIADTNPKRYTRFWKCPAERMYLACIDRDSASDRARGMIVLKKVESNEQKAQDPELMSAI